MSGFEIVGVILGTLPLIVKGAENYSRFADSLAKWKRYRFELRKFVNDVDIERLNFESLCKRLLICTDLPAERQYELLNGKDAQAWKDADLEKVLTRSLGSSCSACAFLLNSMSDDLVKLQKMLSSKDGSTKWVITSENDLEYQLKRLCYSFSSAGSRTLESISTSRKKLKGLLGTLDNSDTQATQRGRTKLTFANNTWVRALKCVRESAGNLHDAMHSGWNNTCRVPHPTSLQLQRRDVQEPQPSFILSLGSHQGIFTPAEYACTILLAKSIKLGRVSIDDGSHKSHHKSSTYLTELRANIDLRTPLDNQGIVIYNQKVVRQDLADNHTISCIPRRSAMKRRLQIQDSNQNISIKIPNYGGVKRKQVRIEHHPSEQPRVELDVVKQRNESRYPEVPELEISDLCRLLKVWKLDRNRTGYLLGPENQRHHLQFMHSRSTVGMITLEELLQESASLRLDRRHRYQAALVLASSVLELQTTRWIPRNFSKKHIYFEISPDRELSQRPMIYAAFENESLIPDQSELSAKEIRQLTCASLTSLGILLLELIFNCAIESKTDLRSEHLHNGQPHRDTNYLVAREWADDVEKEAGWGFMYAIKSCFDFEEKPDWNNSKFIISIHERVIKTLESELDILG